MPLYKVGGLIHIPRPMGIFISLLVAAQIIVCLLLVFLVLMQRPKQEGLGAAFGGGMTDQMFGAQTTDVLQKGTVWLTVMFFVVSMLLAILIANRNEGAAKLTGSLEEGSGAPPPIEATTEGLPSLPKPEPGLTPTVPVDPVKNAKADRAQKGASAAKKDDAAAKKDGAKEGAMAKAKAKAGEAKKDAAAKAAAEGAAKPE